MESWTSLAEGKPEITYIFGGYGFRTVEVLLSTESIVQAEYQVTGREYSWLVNTDHDDPEAIFYCRDDGSSRFGRPSVTAWRYIS